MTATKLQRSRRTTEERPTITDNAMFEIVNGRVEETEPKSVYSVRIAAIIYGHLFSYCHTRNIGEAVIIIGRSLALRRDCTANPPAHHHHVLRLLVKIAVH